MKTWTKEQVAALVQMSATHTHKEIAAVIDMSPAAVRNKLWRLGVRKKVHNWTAEEEAVLVRAYQNNTAEEINLTAVSESLGRHKTNVCRKARELGLTDQKRKMVVSPRVKVARFKTVEELRAYQSELSRARIQQNGHPRGMKGKRHTAAAKAVISQKSRQFAARETEEERAQRMLKANMTRAKRGSLYPARKGATWKAGWREIGGQKKYYRSRWEANYARYLEWLRLQGEIKDWKHEPKTFWFEGIKRGTNSYLPDFWVQENSGAESYHEVKGWMDDRSKTKIRRMAKYHPDVKLIVIDTNAYASIKRSVEALIQGWE